MLNIGGISNLTSLKNNNIILSKDVGPGNCLINSMDSSLYKKKFDKDGLISEREKVNKINLNKQWKHMIIV